MSLLTFTPSLPLLPSQSSKIHTLTHSIIHTLRTPTKRPRIQITSSQNNGTTRQTPSEKEPATPIDPQQTKISLLNILSSLINIESQRGSVEQLILNLESLDATPITDAFTELSLAGKWNLLFSTARTRTQGNIRIRTIAQTFDIHNKHLVNSVRWSFASKVPTQQLYADLNIKCSYKFVGPGRLQVEVMEHAVTILELPNGEKGEVPDDLQALMKELQQALPLEFFDPSGLIDVSYIEPSFRLARFVGDKLSGIRNVFVRDDTATANEPSA